MIFLIAEIDFRSGENMKYGYARVSTKEQNVDRQITAFLGEGIDSRNIYTDKATGSNFNRKRYRTLLKKLKKGDVLYIKSIDRLGRNYEEIINEWNYITKITKVEIVVLDFPLLDTREKVSGGTGKFLTDIILQILSYVAQIERENILERQKEGILEAKKRGVVFGRSKKRVPDEFQEVEMLWKKGKLSLRKGAAILGVSHSTFAKWIKKTEKID
ncbi:MAG: recombinase family protein [Clostridiales bacterium]|nr:recombinase family protein [Clostridiales bacterium]